MCWVIRKLSKLTKTCFSRKFELQHEILLHIVLFSNKGSGESAHMCRLTRAFIAQIHKVWVYVYEDSDQNLDLFPGAPLDTSAWAFIGGYCQYAISTKISCASSFVCFSRNKENLPCTLVLSISFCRFSMSISPIGCRLLFSASAFVKPSFNY